MSPRATVLIPTFDHGPTLLRSVPSALGQTVQDIEVFVVGDGAPEPTREVMAELVGSDDRVRFFDNPKGPGNGEGHRHAALREARGEIVAYLGDDDLWMPEHLEVLGTLVQGADFGHTYPIRIEPDGTIAEWNVDLGLAWFRQAMLDGMNFVPLSCAGHTLELYRRLPHGWRTKPEGMWSDLYMWQQILSVPGVRTRTGTVPTTIHLPSSLRSGWPAERRLQELDRWVKRIARPELREDLYRTVLELTARGHARASVGLEDHREVLEGFRSHTADLEATLERTRQELDDELSQARRDRAEERTSLEARIRALEALLASREKELQTLRRTRTWRFRQWLLRAPVMGTLFRSAGRAPRRRGHR